MSKTNSTKSTARRLAKDLVGTQLWMPFGFQGTITGVEVAQGEVWVFLTVPGAGIFGSDLKTAVRSVDIQGIA
jgi:hypothetical protein